MTKKRIHFIINPISGGKDKRNFEKIAQKYLDPEQYEVTYQQTHYANHAAELALSAVEQAVDLVVAVGGDGTINEVAGVLINTKIPLGIVPEGSGNGLARYLTIPSDTGQAIKRITDFNVKAIDSGLVNDKAFFNMAGIGFDALISNRFASTGQRGAVGYMKLVLEEINRYKPMVYRIQIDGTFYEEEAFMVSIANSPQYGNNAYIAPEASVRDGLLDVCIIRKFPLYQFPVMIYHLFSRTANESEYVKIIKGKFIEIERPEPGPVHLDGEPEEMGAKLSIQIAPSSLNVIY